MKWFHIKITQVPQSNIIYCQTSARKWVGNDSIITFPIQSHPWVPSTAALKTNQNPPKTHTCSSSVPLTKYLPTLENCRCTAKQFHLNLLPITPQCSSYRVEKPPEGFPKNKNRRSRNNRRRSGGCPGKLILPGWDFVRIQHRHATHTTYRDRWSIKNQLPVPAFRGCHVAPLTC